nr:polysaccharide deacetylase family protein [uncultured Mucilaginibacter sp.]
MSVLEKLITKTSLKARYIQGNISHFIGADKSYYERARGSRILAYHGVCQSEPTKFNTLFITRKIFEQHLQYYKRYFNALSLDEYYLEQKSAKKFNICLTFDDGFANNYKYVLPLLHQYQIPATFFVTAISAASYNILWNDILSLAGRCGPPSVVFKNQTYHKNRINHYTNADGLSLNMKLRNTGFAEKAELIRLLDRLCLFHKNKQHEDYWLQMTSDQIRQASASPYITIGAHGYYHNDLAGIPLADAAKEMKQSKQYLEGIIGNEVKCIAFPYGSYNRDVVAAAKACGYTQLLATDFNTPDDSCDVSMRERLTINPFISITNQMHANIRGAY